MPLGIEIIRRVSTAFSADRRGVTALEYALIACVSVMVTVTAVVSVGGGLGNSFDQIVNGFSGVGSSRTTVTITPPAPDTGPTTTVKVK